MPRGVAWETARTGTPDPATERTTMAHPTTRRYPIYLTVPVPLDMAYELAARAHVYERDRNATLRAVIDAGLAALSPTYKEHHAQSEADQTEPHDSSRHPR